MRCLNTKLEMLGNIKVNHLRKDKNITMIWETLLRKEAWVITLTSDVTLT